MSLGFGLKPPASGFQSYFCIHSGSLCLLVGPWVVLGFSVCMEAFNELLLINVPWTQEISDVSRIWT